MHYSSLCRFLRRKLWRKPRRDSMGMAPSAWMYSVSIQCRGWGSDDHSQEDSKPKIITYLRFNRVYIYIHIDIDYRLQIYVCVCLMWYIFVMSYAVLHHINHRVKHKYGLITAGHKKFVRFIPDLCCSIWIGITISIAVDSSSSISMVRDWQKPPLGALPTRIKTSCNDW